MRELGLDLVFVPADTRALHRTAMRAGGDFGRAAHQLQLVLVLNEAQRVERLAHVDDFLGRGDTDAGAAANLVQ